jgi:hypothetical protein
MEAAAGDEGGDEMSTETPAASEGAELKRAFTGEQVTNASHQEAFR